MPELGGAVVQTITVGEAEEVETFSGKQRLTRTVQKVGPMPAATGGWTPRASRSCSR